MTVACGRFVVFLCEEAVKSLLNDSGLPVVLIIRTDELGLSHKPAFPSCAIAGSARRVAVDPPEDQFQVYYV